ncbi:hypothetical protein PLICRDRAFT_637933 [Plicaturopsis crispa FD-325 SS-3]|nr:hypothetical protein PLICRDRAFT_637933 [Plicaturopsis crispa FD-325 SS-3]
MLLLFTSVHRGSFRVFMMLAAIPVCSCSHYPVYRPFPNLHELRQYLNAHFVHDYEIPHAIRCVTVLYNSDNFYISCIVFGSSLYVSFRLFKFYPWTCSFQSSVFWIQLEVHNHFGIVPHNVLKIDSETMRE